MPGHLDQLAELATTGRDLAWGAEQENARLAAIVACSPDAIISVDAADGRILTWNKAAEQLFGWSEQEAVGAPFTMLTPEVSQQEPRALLQQALEGRPVKIETVRRRKDGSAVDVSLTASRIQSSDGRIIAAIAIFRDITERKRAMRALRAQKRVLTMLNRTGAALASKLELDEVIRTATEAGLELTGAQLGAFVFAGPLAGRPGMLCYSAPFAGSERTCRFVAMDERNALPQGFPLGGLLRLDDIEADPRFRPTIWSWAQSLERPIRSCLVVPVVSTGGGTLGGLVFGHSEAGAFDASHEQLAGGVAAQAATAIDIARQYESAQREIEAHRKAEEVLRASEAQFRVLADTMPQMVWSADAAGGSDYYNRQWNAYVGRLDHDLIGDEWLELIHPDDRDRVLAVWNAALAGGERYQDEYRIRRHDGVYRWFLDRGLPLRGADGSILRWIGTCTDIDEQKQAEMELRRLSEVVEQSPDFIGYVAPDGRTLYLNPAGRRMIGLADLPAAQRTRFEDYFHPKDWQLVREMLMPQIAATGQWSGEFRLRRFDDGATVPVDYRLFTTYDSAGAPTGLAAITRDISARKAAEDGRQLLIRELNHRVKNLFAVAAGIVSMSARKAASPREMADVVRGRLGALSRAHDLIRAAITAEGAGHESTTLREIAEAITAPHGNGDSGQIAIDGPPVEIGANAATSVALVLHELATNAVKYGALSTHEGHVRIAWQVDGAALALSWQETGGPAIAAPPTAEGFGTQVARMSVAGQLGGTIATSWPPEGVEVAITLPLDRLLG